MKRAGVFDKPALLQIECADMVKHILPDPGGRFKPHQLLSVVKGRDEQVVECPAAGAVASVGIIRDNSSLPAQGAHEHSFASRPLAPLRKRFAVHFDYVHCEVDYRRVAKTVWGQT
jgi:hypothetical protein